MDVRPIIISSDPFEAAFAEARRRNFGAVEMLRLETLRWEFLARAPPERHAEFARYAAAILTRTHGEHAAFVAPPGATKPATAGVTDGATAVQRLADEPGQDARTWFERHRLRAIAAVLVLLLAVIALIYWNSNRDQTATPVTEVTETPTPTPTPNSVPAPAAKAPPSLVFAPDAWWMLGMTLILLLPAGYMQWHARRRRVLRRDANADPQPNEHVAVRVGRNTLFADRSLRPVLRNLRRHRAVASDRIDVSASLRATVLRAGLPSIRFGKRRLTPEYLLLNEREAPHDHLAELAEALGARLDQAYIVNTRYEFFGEPGAVRRTSGREAERFEDLAGVISRHEGATTMVLMESADALPANGQAPQWLETAAEHTRPVLLNPRETRRWDQDERDLAAHGLVSFPASVAGLAGLAERIVRGDLETAGGPRAPASAEPDLAAYLGGHRTMLLSPDPPDAARIEAVIENLERWLDAGAMDWLRTIALFPVIATGFTFFAGATLAEHTLVTQDRFLALARLPWLRTGQMPGWLRQALVAGFSPARLGRATAVIQAYLTPPPGEVRTREDLLGLRREADAPGARRKLRDRLVAMDHPLSEDTLLLGALNGQEPGELDIALDPNAFTTRRWYRRPDFQAFAGVLAGIALLSWIDPPMRREEVPPEPQPPKENTRPPDAGPTAVATGAIHIAEATPEIDPAVPTAVPEALPPRLYIQVRSEADRARARAAVKKLAGLEVGGARMSFPGIELRRDGPADSQIRCFEPATCTNAPVLQKALSSAGIAARIVPFRANDFTWKSAARPNHYELWIAPSGKAAAPAPAPGPGPTIRPTTPLIEVPTSQSAPAPSDTETPDKSDGPINRTNQRAPRLPQMITVSCEYLGKPRTSDEIDKQIVELVARTKGERVSSLVVGQPYSNITKSCREMILEGLNRYFPGVRIEPGLIGTSLRAGDALEVTAFFAEQRPAQAD